MSTPTSTPPVVPILSAIPWPTAIRPPRTQTPTPVTPQPIATRPPRMQISTSIAPQPITTSTFTPFTIP